MSSIVPSQQNSSPIQTRRAPIRNDDIENNNRRSLSGKFRSLFRKTSSSPNPSTNNDRRPPLAPPQQRSPSPERSRASTEAPHLRAPIVRWPFGKKKTKLSATTSEKTKTKGKSKKTSPTSLEISNPIYQQEHETSIRGQNFVPRTPELTHGATGRTQSSSSYDTGTKGFRDYMIIDNGKSSQQVVAFDTDVITPPPPPYTSDRSRSPSLNHQHLPDTAIEYSYHRDNSPPISDIEIIPIPKQQQQQYTVGGSSSLTTTQILVEQTPLISPPVTQPIHSNQWKNTSYSSLNNTELRSTTSSSMDVDVPKLKTPLIPSTSTLSKKSSTHNDETYNSSSTVNNLNQPNRSNANTYGSLSDVNSIHNESFSSLKPMKSNINKYPGLSAIIENHIRPTSVHFNEHPSPPLTTITTTVNPKRPQRFDTSTTTLDDYDQRQQWSTTITNNSVPSSSSIHYHDAYIRPLTPQKPSIQPDVSMIHVNLDDLHGQSSSRTAHYNSADPPIMYRSSTIIYTKDKHSYAEGGELRTWSIQDNDDIDNHTKPSTSIHILPSKITDEEENGYEYVREPYSNNRYSDNNSSFIQSSILNERDKIYDQSTRSYTEYTQEPLNTITSVENSEVALRHYTLKRTNSYNGLGILISANAETRLNHRIRDIETGSPGSKIGLRKNDRIININGINVENMEFGNVLVLIKQGLINNNLQFSVINDSTFL